MDHGFDPEVLAQNNGFDTFMDLMQSKIMREHVTFEKHPNGFFIYRARITEDVRKIFDEQHKWAIEVDKK